MRRLLFVTIDVVLVGLATIAALLLRDNLETTPQRLADFVPYLSASLMMASLALPSVGLDRAIWRFTTLADATRLAVAAAMIVAGAVAASFAFNRMDGVARAVPIIQGMLIVTFLLGARGAVRLRHSARERPAQLTSVAEGNVYGAVLVVGIGPLTHFYLRAIDETARGRVRVAGLLGRTDRHVGRMIGSHKILGTPEQVEAIVRELAVHGVFIQRIDVTTSFDELSQEAREALLRVERERGVTIEFVAHRLVGLTSTDQPDRPDGASAGGGAKGSGREAVEFRITAEHKEQLAGRPFWRVKRILDVMLAFALLIVLAPLMGIVAVIVALDVGFPVVFWQERPGLGGRPFRVYKFRTMSAAHDADGQPVPPDERISLIGRLLRRTRLDELPQLIHILRGDMSFVGPRPLLPVDQHPEHAARLLVRPGLTGWAQVVGGRDISAADKAALDIWYVQKASLKLDVEILARTAQMVLRGERISLYSIEQAWDELVAQGICQGASTTKPPESTRQPMPFCARHESY